MATLRTYWREVDDLSFNAIERAVKLVFNIDVSKLYESDKGYINKLKRIYENLVNGPMYNALYEGKILYESVEKSIGNIPLNLNRSDLRIAYNRSLSITRDYISAAIDDLSNEVKAMSKNMRSLGMSKPAIVSYWLNERNENRPIFNRFNNRMKKIVDDAVDRAAAFVYNEGIKRRYGPSEQLFDWISVGDGRVCPDCKTRHKQTYTYTEWLKFGVPRAGFTYCLLSCRCILLPSEYVDDELDLTKPVTRMKVVIKDGKAVKKK